MKMSWKSELPILFIVALPFIYLFSIWGSLPEEVPIHWNAAGEVDGYGSKSSLLLLPFLLPVLTYFLMTLIPYIDPKKTIHKMGSKYNQIKFIIAALTAGIACFILYQTQNEGEMDTNIMLAFIGAIFLVFGNYMKTIQPNYFMGIRTPWTLESETVWKKTHEMAGKIWLVGGALIIMIGLFMDSELAFTFMMSIIILSAMIPLVYSYIFYKKEEIK